MYLIALLFCPLAFTTGAFVFSGVLQPMAADLGVSVGAVATLQSAFAIACALCGPPLVHLTRHWRPRTLLLAVLMLLVVLNAASALVADFRVLFTLRLLVGGIGALAFPLATTLAASAVAPAARPKAISTVYAGIPLAMTLAIPAGSVLGNAFGWQASFWAAAAVCAVALALVLAFVPDRDRLEAVAARARISTAVLAHLGITLLVSASLFCAAGLIGPIIRVTTGFDGPGIAAMQLLIGFSSLAGVRLGAGLAAGGGRYGLTLPFIILLGSLAMLLPPLAAGVTATVSLGLMILSVSLGPAAQALTGTLVQTRLAVLAGPGATLAFSLNGSMIYLGQGLGILTGATAADLWGLVAAPLSGLTLVLPGLLLALGIAWRLSPARVPDPA